jgi:hypothetical protein
LESLIAEGERVGGFLSLLTFPFEDAPHFPVKFRLTFPLAHGDEMGKAGIRMAQFRQLRARG